MIKQTQRKYEFTGEEKIHKGRALRRIYRVSDGLIGGWLETEENLDHRGDCFVYEEAWVYGNACVQDNAKASGYTRISGFAILRDKAHATGRTWINGRAVIKDRALIKDRAWVSDEACVCGNALLKGDAGVSDHAIVGKNAVVGGKAWIRGNSRIYSSTPIKKNERLINIVLLDD